MPMMTYFPLETLVKIIEKRKFETYILEQITLINYHENSMNADFTFEIIFKDISSDELFITEFTFPFHYQSELWDDEIHGGNFLSDYQDEDSQVPCYLAKTIMAPKIVKV